MTLAVCAFGDFNLSVFENRAQFVARIRRADGKPILLYGDIRAAIGTKPCATEAAALEEAKALIRRKWPEEAG